MALCCSPSIRVALPVGPAKLMVGESTVPFAKVSHRSLIVQVYLPDFVNTTVVHAVSPAPKITAQP